MSDAAVLVINTGSSSLKVGLFRHSGEDEVLLLDALADGIGHGKGSLTLRDDKGHVLKQEETANLTEGAAFERLSEWLRQQGTATPAAIGHRVVHGGPKLTAHQRITDAVLAELRSSIHFAPLHLPVALDLIALTEKCYPQTPQFACFDTAFHQTLPEESYRFALPDRFAEMGVRRYGFHGLSYESILHQLGSDIPPRVVLAHLGSGASLAAVREGKSVDTSMGLTPTGGIPMATRTGDIDPGVLLFLLREGHLSAEELESLLNHDSGLKALSHDTGDMRTIQEAMERGDHNAQLAFHIFCQSIARTIASYAVTLEGLDMIVFAGGIGEHSAEVRAEVCQRLAWLGVVCDTAHNQAHAKEISSEKSSVRVLIVPSEEDKQIARHCRRMLADLT